MDARPIGVFDSGVGGLTAIKELKAILPHEDMVYFGDTARVPYGTRSDATVIRYTEQCIRFLLSRDVKLIVVACGTVSAVALPRHGGGPLGGGFGGGGYTLRAYRGHRYRGGYPQPCL